MVSRLRDLDIYGNDLADRAYVLEPAPASPLEPLVSPARQAVGSAVDTAAITAAWQRARRLPPPAPRTAGRPGSESAPIPVWLPGPLWSVCAASAASWPAIEAAACGDWPTERWA
ncbi:hypothetical protein BOX15_Mlig021172g1 [Macrostomum lignano]|uniref:Uncharacterized protein n=1 Tax=Macrostomum lignano TaxID=282301 RepID=A0A267E2X6_9PLAT|nr:hypothetical protein BOX15_Mlig021172g1 [Macrostomum lignano]